MSETFTVQFRFIHLQCAPQNPEDSVQGIHGQDMPIMCRVIYVPYREGASLNLRSYRAELLVTFVTVLVLKAF